MTRDEFVSAGQALFGESWVGPLASASGIERRSIARMINQGDDDPVTQRTRAILERSLNRIFER